MKRNEKEALEEKEFKSGIFEIFSCADSFERLPDLDALETSFGFLLFQQLCRGHLKLFRMLKIAQIGVHLGLQNVEIQKVPEAQREL